MCVGVYVCGYWVWVSMGVVGVGEYVCGYGWVWLSMCVGIDGCGYVCG